MTNLWLWSLTIIGILGSYCCYGYEYDEFLNKTEVLYKDSIFGVSAATYSPLTVGLTIIQGAGSRGAGIILFLLTTCIYYNLACILMHCNWFLVFSLMFTFLIGCSQ